jgi:hypothetical protein
MQLVFQYTDWVFWLVNTLNGVWQFLITPIGIPGLFSIAPIYIIGSVGLLAIIVVKVFI